MKDISFSNDSNNGTVNVTKTYGNASSATSVFANGNITAYNSIRLGGLTASNLSVNYATNADHINDLGNQTAISNGTILDKGLRLYQACNNGYPTAYGNVLNLGGNGDGQLLIGWSGSSGGTASNYVRSRRDVDTVWSSWAELISSANIGSQSVNYATSAGSATNATYATSAGSAGRLGSTTVGNSTTPAYFSGGSPTACSYSFDSFLEYSIGVTGGMTSGDYGFWTSGTSSNRKLRIALKSYDANSGSLDRTVYWAFPTGVQFNTIPQIFIQMKLTDDPSPTYRGAISVCGVSTVGVTVKIGFTQRATFDILAIGIS